MKVRNIRRQPRPPSPPRQFYPGWVGMDFAREPSRPHLVLKPHQQQVLDDVKRMVDSYCGLYPRQQQMLDALRDMHAHGTGMVVMAPGRMPGMATVRRVAMEEWAKEVRQAIIRTGWSGWVPFGASELWIPLNEPDADAYVERVRAGLVSQILTRPRREPQ